MQHLPAILVGHHDVQGDRQRQVLRQPEAYQTVRGRDDLVTGLFRLSLSSVTASGLSSITRTIGRDESGPYGTGPDLSILRQRWLTGMGQRNCQGEGRPCPSMLSAVRSPPNRRARLRLIERPRPVPP
jgi:hypothetical protein